MDLSRNKNRTSRYTEARFGTHHVPAGTIMTIIAVLGKAYCG